MSRLSKLQDILKDQAIEALFISSGANIRYLTGYTGTDAYLLALAQGNSMLITDFRFLEQAEQECSPGKCLEICRCDGKSRPLFKLVAEKAQEENLKSLAFEEEHSSFAFYRRMQEALGELPLKPAFGLVEGLRAHKDSQEQNCLRRAAAMADAAFQALLKEIVPGITEKRLEALLIYELACQGSEEPAFPPIIASGVNGSLCHAIPSHKKLAKGELITFDFGAVYQGYRSDITRTLCLGRPDAKQKELYHLVLEAQTEAKARVKKGAACNELDQTAREIISVQGYGAFFGHGLGHGIGLEVHEKPVLNSTNPQPLLGGEAITIEPGIYIPGWGGIRIEDSLLVGDEGGEVITAFPRELIEL